MVCLFFASRYTALSDRNMNGFPNLWGMLLQCNQLITTRVQLLCVSACLCRQWWPISTNLLQTDSQFVLIVKV